MDAKRALRHIKVENLRSSELFNCLVSSLTPSKEPTINTDYTNGEHYGNKTAKGIK
jgi:hypothetical protein